MTGLSPTAATIAFLAFGAVTGAVTLSALLFAAKMAKVRGWGAAGLSLAATLLAMLLLVAAGAQLHDPWPKALPEPKLLIDSSLAFLSQTAFIGAALAGAALAFVLSPARTSPGGTAADADAEPSGD